MKQKLKELVENISWKIAGVAIGASALFAGYSLVKDINKEPVIINPSEIDYSHWRMQVRDYSFEGQNSERYAWDIDKDGKIDALGAFGNIDWVAPGYEDKVNKNKYQRTMTPRMIEHVSKMKKDQDTFSKMMAEETVKQIKNKK